MAARDDTPSIREITELTARLRRLSSAGRDADPAERAAFLADKDALIDRIETANRQADTGREGRSRAAAAVAEAHDALTAVCAPETETTTDDARAAELARWRRRPDEHADATTDDDSSGQSR